MVAENVQIEGLSRADRRAEILRARTVARENPVGTIIMGGWTVAPRGYLLLDGTLITNGATFYRDLATVFPGWVSGADLQLPDANGLVMMGTSGTTGATGGSATATLVEANLPAHNHSMTHGHADTFSIVNSSGHTHGQTDARQSLQRLASGGGNSLALTSGTQLFYWATWDDDGTPGGVHNHTINGSVTAFTGPTGDAGSGTPVSIVPAHMTVKFAVKF